MPPVAGLFWDERLIWAHPSYILKLECSIQNAIMGRYIQRSDNLCHSPSQARAVPFAAGLSAMMNKTKKTAARKKQIKENAPHPLLEILKKYIPISNGANTRHRKPIAAPQPWILAPSVARLFDSPTEKRPERMQPPTAYTPITAASSVDSGLDTALTMG